MWPEGSFQWASNCWFTAFRGKPAKWPTTSSLIWPLSFHRTDPTILASLFPAFLFLCFLEQLRHCSPFPTYSHPKTCQGLCFCCSYLKCSFPQRSAWFNPSTPLKLYSNSIFSRRLFQTSLYKTTAFSPTLSNTFLCYILLCSLKTFISLVLVTLGLCFCLQSFSSCREWGLLSSCGLQASHRSGFSC